MTIEKFMNLCEKKFKVNREYRTMWSNAHDIDNEENWIVSGNEIWCLSACWNKDVSELLQQVSEIKA